MLPRERRRVRERITVHHPTFSSLAVRFWMSHIRLLRELSNMFGQ